MNCPNEEEAAVVEAWKTSMKGSTNEAVVGHLKRWTNSYCSRKGKNYKFDFSLYLRNKERMK